MGGDYWYDILCLGLLAALDVIHFLSYTPLSVIHFGGVVVRKAPVAVRLDSTLVEEVRGLAAAAGWPLSQMIRVLLREALAARGPVFLEPTVTDRVRFAGPVFAAAGEHIIPLGDAGEVHTVRRSHRDGWCPTVEGPFRVRWVAGAAVCSECPGARRLNAVEQASGRTP